MIIANPSRKKTDKWFPMGSKALIIDDDPQIRGFVAQVLSNQGFEVLEAANGKDGVELARTRRPSMVICDVCMDGLDGYETLRKIRLDPISATIPFIMITATPESTGMRQGMSLGADDYLPKPFSVSDLLATIKAQEQKRSLQNAQEEKRLRDLRSSLSRAMPHELFTPLNGIIGFAELLSNSPEDFTSQQIREMAGVILRSSDRLQHVITNYLAFAQLELVATDPEKMMTLRSAHCFTASGIIESTAGKVAENWFRKADLQTQIQSADLPISDEHMAKITEELVDNSFKFSLANTRVSINGVSDGSSYRLTFQNFGREISDEQIKQIGAFSQFDRSKHEQQGVGLGLAIVKKIVEAIGARLVVRCAQGETSVMIEFSNPGDNSKT